MSITLTTGTQVSINSVSVENDTQGAVLNFTTDFLANTCTFNLAQGVVQGSNFNVGVYGSRLSVNVNLTTGAWTSSNGLSGTLAGAGFNNIVAQFKSDRNLMESFSAGASNILPGTQVAWA
jgi:hypothetical protein